MELQEGNLVQELVKEGETCKAFSLSAYLGRYSPELALTAKRCLWGGWEGRKEKEWPCAFLPQRNVSHWERNALKKSPRSSRRGALVNESD